MAEPTWLSPSSDDGVIETARKGAALLGLPLLPQGENVARVLGAVDADGLPLYPTTGILMPRRSTKTTSIWATILGRCLEVEGFRAVTTAQDGTRARRRFREVARTLERNGFVDAGHKIRWANGDEALEFANGSLLWVVPPRSDAFRSEAADVMLFDEAGELDPSKSDDLLEGALPLLDTRPMGQAIIAGTPARSRVGLLWDTLQDGRNAEPATGIVDYSLRDNEEFFTVDDNGEMRLIEEVVRRVHPGIGTLTTWAKMQARFKKMGPVSFGREYMCRFPFDNATSAIDIATWDAAAVEEEARPERFGLAFDVARDGVAAAVCAAWRDENGVARVGVLEHREGVSWLAGWLHTKARAWKVPVRYDAIGSNHGPASEIDRRRGVKLVPGTMREAMAATQRLVSDLNDGNLHHFGQGSLTSAAEGAAWRQQEGGRLFGWRHSAADITPLNAAAWALWQFDQTPARQPVKIRRAA